MNPSYKDIKQIKRLYKEIHKHQDDPTKKSLVQSNRDQIRYELKNYKLGTEEDFGREHSFCVDCGTSLNQDNDCPGCGRKYGW